MTPGPGILVTLEGIDGSGKSTLAACLAARARAAGHEVLLTREPSYGPVGASLRRWVGQGDSLPVITDPATLALLFTADRHEHITRVLAPALAQGQVVICDRYVVSTLAYQGGEGGVPLSTLWHQHPVLLEPALTLALRLDPARASTRLARRGISRDAFETLPALERQHANLAAALRFVVDQGWRVEGLEGGLDEATLEAQAWALVEPCCPRLATPGRHG